MVHLGALLGLISHGLFCETCIMPWYLDFNFIFPVYDILNNSNQNESLWLQFWQCHKLQSLCGNTGCLPLQQGHETSMEVWPRTRFREKKNIALDLHIFSNGKIPMNFGKIFKWLVILTAKELAPLSLNWICVASTSHSVDLLYLCLRQIKISTL